MDGSMGSKKHNRKNQRKTPRLDGCMFGRLTRELRAIGLLGPGYSEVPIGQTAGLSTNTSLK